MGVAVDGVLAAVEQAIRVQLEAFADEERLASVEKYAIQESKDVQEKQLRSQLAQQQNVYKKLVESLSQGLVVEEEFIRLQGEYKAELERLGEELAALSTERLEQEQVAQLRAVLQEGLTGKLAQALIERVVVGRDKVLEVQFRYHQ